MFLECVAVHCCAIVLRDLCTVVGWWHWEHEVRRRGSNHADCSLYIKGNVH